MGSGEGLGLGPWECPEGRGGGWRGMCGNGLVIDTSCCTMYISPFR